MMKFVPSILLLTSCCFPLVLSAQETMPGDELDQQVAGIFRAKCVMCHDGLPGSAGGDVDYLLNFVELANPENGYVDANQPADSYLRQMIADKSMPKQRYRDLEWAGELSAAEQTAVFNWIDRSGPSPAYRNAFQEQTRTVVGERKVLELVAADLQQLQGQQLKHARYLTLTNLHNNPDVKAADLEVYRQALVKLLNSLSRSSDVLGLDTSDAVNKIAPVDGEARTIFRIDLRDIGWEVADWELVVKHYPYAINFRDGLARSVYTATGTTELPYLRADWFVFATSQPPLYHDLVGIPKTLAELEQQLGVNRVQNIQNRKVARAGFGQSKVSVNNRMIERHPLNQGSGAYHISYDFATNDNAQNFFENPLGPVDANLSQQVAFKHDGGEVIFNLPNGFQAYALVTAAGQRLSLAPTAIVHDDSMPGGAIINGLSCISCHYQGMKPENPQQVAKLDQVRDLALQNFRRFSGEERELIGELFVEQETLKRLLDSDSRRFQNALKLAGLTPTANEPVRALFNQFAADLTLNTVASEVGLTADEVTKLFSQESETRQLLQRLQNEGIKRQLFLVEFARLVRLTGIGETRSFVPLVIPYFGQDPEQVLAIQQPLKPEQLAPQQAAASAQPQYNNDLLDAENRTGELKISVKAENDQKHYEDGEVMRCVVKANRDCYLTLLSIDSAGDVTVLVPNKWHPSLPLEAGRTVVIPTAEMGFEIAAQPPHGATILRAIATTRPLKLKGVTTKSLQADGMITYKGLGIRPKTEASPNIGVRPQPTPQQPRQQLTEQELAEQFEPGEWATAQWTLITHAKP